MAEHTFSSMGRAVGSLPYRKIKPGGPIEAAARWADHSSIGSLGISAGG
jgi:hypothetical protein